MENLNPLYKYLKTNAPLLIGDRSVSTFGRRVLKGLRSFHSGWPLSGVYLPTEIAEKLIQKYSHLKHTASDWELFCFLSRERSDQKLDEVFEDFMLAKNLRKLINYTGAAKIIQHEEIAERAQGVLYTLLLMQKYANENECYAHSFDKLDEASELLRNKDTIIDFHSFDEPNEFCLIGFRELYPAESELVEQLSERLRKVVISDELLEGKHQIPNALCDIEECTQILWASDLEAPAPLEAKLLTGSSKPLRLAVASQLRKSSPKLDEIKNSWPNSTEWIDQALELCQNEDETKLLKQVKEEKSNAAPVLLESLGFFQKFDFGFETTERPLPLSQNPKDPVLLTLEDIVLIEPQTTALWAKPEKLKEIVSDFCSKLDPLKNLKDLEKHLLSEGISIPRIEEEQKNFEKYFYSFSKNFRILKQKKSPTWEQVPHFEIKSSKISSRLSPSALENLHTCSLNFYYSKEEKLEQFELEDDLNISPMRKGNWVHYTLEQLPWSKPEKITLEMIKKALKEKLPKAFDKNSSEAYKKIIEAQAGAMADALFHYIQAVDIPLNQNFPARKSQSEVEVTSDLEINNRKVPLKGRVDRLDFVGDGALLWDYKNGNFSKSKLSKHLEVGTFQWLLYREIFNLQGTPIHGGGYINPMSLKKSRLFFFHQAPMAESFYENLERHEIKFERISQEEEKFLRDELYKKLSVLVETWSSGLRKALPSDPTDCNYCAYIGRCGYPYGVTP